MSGKINVAVDARRLFGSGIGRYTSGVIEALEQFHESNDISLSLVVNSDSDIQKYTRFTKVLLNEPILFSWRRSNLNSLLLSSNADVFISPQYYTTPYLDIPCIRVLHDAHPFWPDYFSPSSSVFSELYGVDTLIELAKDLGLDDPEDSITRQPDFIAKLICQMYIKVSEYASELVTVSHFSASDLTRYMPQTAGRWNILYPFVDSAFSATSLESFQDYHFLSVSKLEPRKQQLEIIDSIQSLREATNINLTLTLIGGRTASFPEYADLVERKVASLGSWVKLLSNISDSELAQNYREASFSIFASLSEGFGYPALESLASGTPLIAATGSSLPEICGPFAYYIDPKSSITDAIKEVVFSDLCFSSDEFSAHVSRFSKDAFGSRLYKLILGCL
jgi:glycosyltransferase